MPHRPEPDRRDLRDRVVDRRNEPLPGQVRARGVDGVRLRSRRYGRGRAAGHEPAGRGERAFLHPALRQGQYPKHRPFQIRFRPPPPAFPVEIPGEEYRVRHRGAGGDFRGDLSTAYRDVIRRTLHRAGIRGEDDPRLLRDGQGHSLRPERPRDRRPDEARRVPDGGTIRV